MSNRTIWNVMKTYNEKGVYYQVLPYNVRVIYDIFRSRGGGFWAVIKFLRIVDGQRKRHIKWQKKRI